MSELLKSSEILKAASAAGTLGKDKGFVESLLESYIANGSLSAKQEYWFHKMAEKHNGSKPAEAAPAPAPTVGAFGGVYALFLKAKEHLKFPKINLKLTNGDSVVLHLAGPKSKKPGVINVTNGGKFGTPTNKWYGRVNPDGSLETASSAAEIFPEFSEVTELLKTLGAAPAAVAAKHGKLTGHCCFCNRKLTDEDKSTAVGYGPVCAKNYGLYENWKAGEAFFETLAKATLDKAVAEVLGVPVEALSKPVIPAPAVPASTPVPVAPAAPAPTVIETPWDLPSTPIKNVVRVAKPVDTAKVAKPVVVAVPEPEKGDDYLF